jgi:hypothetical protein
MTFNKKTLNYRFPIWLTVIFFTLFSIPVLVYFDLLTLAKISGVVTVVLTSIALRFWMNVAKHKTETVSRVPITKNDIFDLKRIFPYFNQLSSNEQIELQDKIALTLARFRFVNELGEHYSKLNSIQIALFIVLTDSINLNNFKNCVILNSDKIIDTLKDADSVYSYPLKTLIDEKLIGKLSILELSQQEKVINLALFLSKISN